MKIEFRILIPQTQNFELNDLFVYNFLVLEFIGLKPAYINSLDLSVSM